jgi:cation diffusion facilitator family transporter
MHSHNLEQWQHSHVFGQDRQRAGEIRTLVVVLITAAMMVVEIVAGIVFGSMALLADGLHMASHAAALGISFLAYVVSRRLASDRSFTLGVGKINSLAGYTSAVMLMGFALLMVVESTDRLLNPVSIAFENALLVAVVGLIVNGLCAWILVASPGDHHGQDHHHHHHHHDHNLRAAYLHVLADALTSLLAIAALLAGKYFGASWLDPTMGIVGALLVARWSLGLITDSSRVLLDRQVDDGFEIELRDALEAGTGDRIADLHCWVIGPGIHAAEIVLVSDEPSDPSHYRSRIPEHLNIVHATIEVHRCDRHGSG